MTGVTPSDLSVAYPRLVTQARQVVRLRWVVFIVALAMLGVIGSQSELSQDALEALGWLYGGVIAANLTGDMLYRRLGEREPGERAYNLLLATISLHLFFDLVIITLAVHFTGGPASPNTVIYYLSLGIVAFVLPRRHLIALVSSGMALYTLLMLAYLSGRLVPPPFGAALEINRGISDQHILATMVFTDSFMVLFTALLYMVRRELESHIGEIRRQQRFLGDLHNLTLASLHQDDLVTLYQALADQVKDALGCDCVYLTRYDGFKDVVLPMAASGAMGDVYRSLGEQPLQGSLTLALAERGEEIIVKDAAHSPVLSPDIARRFPAHSLLALPLFEYGRRRRFLGGMMVAYDQEHDFSPREIAAARQFADTLALILTKGLLYDAIRRRQHWLEKLVDFDLMVGHQLNMDVVLPALGQIVMELLESGRLALFLYDDVGPSYTCRFAIGLSEEFTRWISESYKETPHIVVLGGKMVYTLPDVAGLPPQSELRQRLEAEGVMAMAIFSLSSVEGVQGTLTCYWDTPRRLSLDEINIGHLLAFRAGQAVHGARVHARAVQQALTDSLTGLPNRRALDQMLEKETYRAARYQHPLALIMIDMDGFKLVNDRLGHEEGDRILIAMSRCLQAALRESDVVARFGGDEFTVIAPHTDLQGALRLADKIRQAVETCNFGLLDIPLSVSQGVAVFPQDGSSASDLLRCADQALYRAKRSRPGTVMYAGDDDLQK